MQKEIVRWASPENRVTPHALYNAEPKAMLRLALGGIPHHVRICIHFHIYPFKSREAQRLRGVYTLRYTHTSRNNREYPGPSGEMDVYNVL